MPEGKFLDDPSLQAMTDLADMPMPLAALSDDYKKKGLDDAVDWLRHNNPKPENVDDPTLKALANLTGLPLEEDLTPFEKQEFLDDALDWLCNNDPRVEGIPGDPMVESMTKLAGMPLPPGVIPQKDRKKAIDDSLEWLRNNDPDFETVDLATMDAFSAITGIRVPEDMTPENKKKFVDDSLDWIQQNDDPDIDEHLDDFILEPLTTLADIPLPKRSKKREKQKKAMDDAIEWLRHRNPNLEDVDDPTIDSFADLTALSAPKNRSPKIKKKFMEDAIDWIRNNEPKVLDNLDDPTVDDNAVMAREDSRFPCSFVDIRPTM